MKKQNTSTRERRQQKKFKPTASRATHEHHQHGELSNELKKALNKTLKFHKKKKR